MQHASLLANCRLLELLVQQLMMDRSVTTDLSHKQVHQPTMLGDIGWQQLIVQCFVDTARAASVTLDIY